MTDKKPTTASRMGRRRFISESARMLAGVGLLGLGLAQLARQSHANPAWAIRPPGALAEQAFLNACVRCGMCVRDCPYGTLKLSNFGEAVANGSPYFIARDVPCEMCDDIPCVAACPTGALDKKLTDINDARMGLAILIDEENCLNFQGLRCDVCYRVCPAIDKAITLEMRPNLRTGKHALFIPTVHSDACTGCGKCEKSCVLEKAAIKVLPLTLALGELGHHYRWGWKNKVDSPENLVLEPRMPQSPAKDQLP